MSNQKISIWCLFLNTVGKRIQHILEAEGLNQTELANLLEGVTTKQSVSRYLKDERFPDFDFLYELQRKLGYSMLWVGKGEGPEKILEGELKKEDIIKIGWQNMVRANKNPKIANIFKLVVELSEEQIEALEKVIQSMRK